jgi:hypothetical protein
MCGRDEEAGTVFLAHHDLLPAPGTRTRHTWGVHTIAPLDWDARSETHAAVCARRGPDTLAHMFPATEALAPWPQRRRRLLALLTGTPAGDDADRDLSPGTATYPNPAGGRPSSRPGTNRLRDGGPPPPPPPPPSARRGELP